MQVFLERVNSHLEITVADSGEGIKPELLPHVFERFRQADSTTTRRCAGLGLGLAIVKQLVELHGGSVMAKSPGEGKGATFVVLLPLTLLHEDAHNGDATRVHPAAAGFADSDPCGMPDLTGVQVLLVDDEADARHLVKKLLEGCHAGVRTAASAAEALAMLAEKNVDVIISDIGMPVFDGYEFIRQVRARPPEQGGTVPAMALTAFARSEDRMRAMMAGYNLHLSKPIEPNELLIAVASLAGRTLPGSLPGL